MGPKLKETTVNIFELRLDRSIEEYTRENSESVKQYARIGLLLYLLLKLPAWYDCLLHHFSLTSQLPLISVEN